MKPIKVPLLLASASPRRRRLMASLPWPVRVRPSHIPEPPPPKGASPRAWVVMLARKKAESAARKVERGLVLGADTMVYQGGRAFGKPSSQKEARKMLEALSGKWHSVYTGVSLVARPGGETWIGAAHTRVKMRAFSPEKLDFWSGRNHDKAGAYAAQQRGSIFVEKLRGDYDNVVGLPMREVRRLLKRARSAGYIPF